MGKWLNWRKIICQLNNCFSQQISVLFMPVPQRKRLGGWTILKCSYSVVCGWHWAEKFVWCTWLRQISSSKNLLQQKGGIFPPLLLWSSGCALACDKQIQLPTQQKSNMDERVDALYDWVKSPQVITGNKSRGQNCTGKWDKRSSQ